MQIVKNVLVAVTLALGVMSCSDDPVMIDPPLQNEYYPLPDSGYSIIRTVELYENNAEIAGTETQDSLTWGVRGTYFGASGRPEFVHHDDGTIDTQYVSNVNNMVHWHQPPIELPGLSPSGFVPFWQKIADFSGATGWTMLDDSLKNLRLDGDTLWRFNGKVFKTALKGGLVDVEYGDNQTIRAQEFTYTTTFDGTVILDTNANIAPLQFTLNERAYFAEDVGFIKFERDFLRVTFQSGNYPIFGVRRTLLRKGTW
jgi:hypothetical protein